MMCIYLSASAASAGWLGRIYLRHVVEPGGMFTPLALLAHRHWRTDDNAPY